MSIILLDPSLQDILLDSSRWKLVSSLFPPDVPPLGSCGHTARIERSRFHFHNCRQIVVPLRGESTYIHAERVYPWYPGVVFYHDAFETHDDGTGWPTDTEYLEITLLGDDFLAYHCTWKDRYTIYKTGVNQIFNAAELSVPLNSYWSELARRRNLDHSLARMMLLSATGLLIARILDSQIIVHTSSGVWHRENILDLICTYIQQTGGIHVTLENVARITQCSPRHFERLFRKHTGMSLGRYTQIYRARMAEERCYLKV